MNLETKVIGFLVVNEGRDYCDACIAATFGTAATAVRTILLAARRRSASILRDRWVCELCAKQGEVTRVLGGRTIARKSRLRRRAFRAA